MFFYGEVYPLIESFAKSGFLGSVTLSDWLGLSPGVIAFLVILMALGMFWGAEILESKFAEKESVIEDNQDKTLEKVGDTV